MSPHEIADVLIVGAGPAGSAAAIEAERAGLHTVCIDKATFPRDKCCGDGLTAGALRHLEALGLDPAEVPSWQVVDDVLVGAPDRSIVSFPLPRDNGQFAAIARRAELDAALVNLARKGGSDIREGIELTSIVSHPDHIEATIADAAGAQQTLRARYVVAADGMWSPIRKLLGLGLPKYRGDWHAFRQYFANVGDKAANDLYVWFEPDLLPGYVWSFPLADGTANVGFGIQRDTGHRIQDMKELWPDILARPHIREVLGADATPESPHKAWPIPARLGDITTSHGRLLFVGDATAATDPMTGEGIGQAIETGRLAIDAIVAGADPASVRAHYDGVLTSGMVKDHGLAGALSSVLASQLGANASVKIAGLTPWTRRNFARWLFEDYPRAVLGTPKRWTRNVFTKPGAYRA